MSTFSRSGAYPLRGGLGETRYTHLRPTGELVTESALLVPNLAGYFLAFGIWPPDAGRLTDDVLAQLALQVRGSVAAGEVLLDDAVPLPGLLTALDSGAIVVRPGPGAPACMARMWMLENR